MKKYPKYKNSGIEWIGKIPNHWNIIQLKYCSKNYDGKRIPLSGEERENRIGSFPYYGATGIIDYIDDYIFDGEFLLIGEDGAPFFIKNKDVAYIAKGKFWVNNHAHILEINGKCNIRFAMYSLNSVDYTEYIKGSTRDKLNQSDLSRIIIPYPILEEQNQIANYLDQKTKQIDTLIEKKQKLIELLKEKRTAIINQAVTKGLDPNVTMKDSGIEWLGEIPEHWELKRLRFISKIKYGLGQPPKQKENGLPLIRATNIERGKIIEKDLIFVDPDDIPYDREPILETNDIIVVRSGAYTADSAIITEKYNGAVTGYDLVVKANSINAELLAYALLSNYVLYNQLYLHRLRAAQPHLNAEELGETIILCPPTNEEQEELVRIIKSEILKIDNVIEKTLKEIELLKEYRTTLISEVVTGKIDVKN